MFNPLKPRVKGHDLYCMTNKDDPDYKFRFNIRPSSGLTQEGIP